MRLSTVPIDSNPNKLGGTTCIADTRMPVEDFFIHLMQGGSIHTFIKRHGGWLKPEQLKAVLQFASLDMANGCDAVERARIAVGEAVRQRRDAAEVALA